MIQRLREGLCLFGRRMTPVGTIQSISVLLRRARRFGSIRLSDTHAALLIVLVEVISSRPNTSPIDAGLAIPKP